MLIVRTRLMEVCFARLAVGLVIVFVAGCNSTATTEVKRFCDDMVSGSQAINCDRHAFFAGPDLDNAPISFLDSLSGQEIVVEMTSRSDFFSTQKARIPKLFRKKHYTDNVTQQFFIHASGFPGQNGDFNWRGDAADLTVAASWEGETENQLVNFLTYPTDTLPYRHAREIVQVFQTHDPARSKPHVLEARFVGGLGLVKLRVGPYAGGDKVYLRKDPY